MKHFKYIFLFIALISFSVYAHGNEKHGTKKAKPDTIVIVGNDTVSVNGKAYVKGSSTTKTAEESAEANIEEAEEGGGDLSLSALFEHPHNKIIHFPIALGVLIFLLALIGYKKESTDTASKAIAVIGTLAAAAAIITGYSQAAPFEGTNAYQLVEIHRFIGFVVFALYLILDWALFTVKSNKIILILSFLLTLAVSAAGFYGGVVAH